MAYLIDELRRKVKSEQTAKSAAYRDRDRYKELTNRLLEENANLKAELRKQGGPGRWALEKLIVAQEENARLKKHIVELEEKRGLQKADH